MRFCGLGNGELRIDNGEWRGTGDEGRETGVRAATQGRPYAVLGGTGTNEGYSLRKSGEGRGGGRPLCDMGDLREAAELVFAVVWRRGGDGAWALFPF